MSGATAQKQKQRHPDLKSEDYKIVQQILNNGKIAKGNKPSHYIDNNI